MELRNLRHFAALAKHLNYSRAAEELGISQPALTRSIQAFERRSGTRLFDRDRSGVRLTHHGQQLAERAKALLAEADDFERHLRQVAQGEEGRVRFGMAPLPAWALLPVALREAVTSAPHLAFEVAVRNVEALWPLLTSGEVEFFVSAEGQVPDNPPVRAEPLGSFPVTLLGRNDHPLLNNGSSGRTFPLLMSSRAGATGTLAAQLQDRFSPVHVIEEHGVLVSLTQATDAVWLSSAYSVPGELQAGTLRILEWPEEDKPRTFQLMLYSLNQRSQSPGARKLKQIFREVIRDLASSIG